MSAVVLEQMLIDINSLVDANFHKVERGAERGQLIFLYKKYYNCQSNIV